MPPDAPWFVDQTEAVGLDFVHEVGPAPLDRYFLPHVMGSGAAVLDFDNDGRLDLYFVQNNGLAVNRLYRQTPEGRFVDVTAGSGLDVSGQGMGVAVGDVTNDGLPDVLVTEYGRSRLFVNEGGGRFRDVTAAAGIENPLWGSSAAFFDYDRDGWLDLVIGNYVVYDATQACIEEGVADYCHPKQFHRTAARLYRNEGLVPGASPGNVRFRDVTLASGLGLRAGPALGVLCADFTGDRWPDILVANDAAANFLWINQRDGTFREEGIARGIAYGGMGQPLGNMGIALGDVDGDGLDDVVVTHLTLETHTLWTQKPRGLFHDRTAAAGLAAPRWRGTGFGTVLADFDQDGRPDLAVVNGRVGRPRSRTSLVTEAGLAPFWQPYAERNQLFANAGGRFRDISADNDPFCGTAAVSRGLVCADLDGDGALDLLVTAIGSPARLYRNTAQPRGHWLQVRAIDPALGGRDAQGSEVTAIAGKLRWHRLVQPGYSYLCSNDPRVHFGLGATARLDVYRVVWPDGSEEAFPGTLADRLVVLRKGTGVAVDAGAPPPTDEPQAPPGAGSGQVLTPSQPRRSLRRDVQQERSR